MKIINIYMFSIKDKVNNLKFKTKTMICFLCISLIPLLILGGFCFFETRSLLRSQAINNLNHTLSQTSLILNNQFSIYNTTIDTLSFNNELIDSANMEYKSTYNMYEQLNYTIDDLFNTTRSLIPSINKITLYTGTNLPSHGTTVHPIEELNNASWYSDIKDSYTARWYSYDNSLICAKHLLSIKPRVFKENIITMHLSKSSIFQPLTALSSQNINSIIVDSHDRIIYATEESLANNLDISKLYTADSFCYKDENYTVMNTDMQSSNWRLFIYTPTSQITQSSLLISITVFIMIFVCLIIIFIVGQLFSKKMTYRIDKLRENMNMVENGVLKVNVYSDSHDEIGELIEGFGKMVYKIDSLINENYIAQIKQKEFELKALVAQINPHFLYNSLSLINWRAIKIHADDISKMSQLLSTFYRTTLNKGNNLTTISSELLNVQSYLNIQLIMHSNNFDVIYDLDYSLTSETVPNLILQPLVENSILHGIENNENKQGKICISSKIEGNYILLSVSDNGIGIPESYIEDILKKNSKGYGLKNVDERIKIIYGIKYGVSIRSTEHVGTTVTIKLPYSLKM